MKERQSAVCVNRTLSVLGLVLVLAAPNPTLAVFRFTLPALVIGIIGLD